MNKCQDLVSHIHLDARWVRFTPRGRTQRQMLLVGAIRDKMVHMVSTSLTRCQSPISSSFEEKGV